MNNQWNKIIYKFWAPMYDTVFNKGSFSKVRKQLFDGLSFKKGEKILFVGVGTGADLEYVPRNLLEVTAIDYSSDMLSRAKQRFHDVDFKQMDAGKLEFQNDSFEYVAASLILSVVPDAEKAMDEMLRVVKPGGVIVIFDKFAPRGKQLSLGKKLLRPVIGMLGTDIGVSFEKLYEGIRKEAAILEDQDVLFNGMYRKILIEKKG